MRLCFPALFTKQKTSDSGFFIVVCPAKSYIPYMQLTSVLLPLAGMAMTVAAATAPATAQNVPCSEVPYCAARQAGTDGMPMLRCRNRAQLNARFMDGSEGVARWYRGVMKDRILGAYNRATGARFSADRVLVVESPGKGAAAYLYSGGKACSFLIMSARQLRQARGR